MLQTVSHFSVHFGFEKLLALPHLPLDCLSCVTQAVHLALFDLLVVHHVEGGAEVRMLAFTVQIFHGYARDEVRRVVRGMVLVVDRS